MGFYSSRVNPAIVSRQERIRTWQAVPLAVRIGVETPGFFTADEGKERP